MTSIPCRTRPPLKRRLVFELEGMGERAEQRASGMAWGLSCQPAIMGLEGVSWRWWGEVRVLGASQAGGDVDERANVDELFFSWHDVVALRHVCGLHRCSGVRGPCCGGRGCVASG